ncbi:MAG: DUF4149 domain-containing protein [Janthinobacterium lividum]
MSAIFDSFAPRLSLASRLRLLLVTLWVGSIWTIGYMVAPVLFSTLADPVLAGTIAGKLFRIDAWFSLACVVILTVLVSAARRELSHKQHKACLLLLLGMLLCTLVGYFAVSPMMAALREAAGPNGVMLSQAKTRFGVLHGVAGALFFIKSLFSAVLVFKIR